MSVEAVLQISLSRIVADRLSAKALAEDRTKAWTARRAILTGIDHPDFPSAEF